MIFKDQNFTKGVMVAALTAAQQAAEKVNASLGPENSRGFDCGFAWVEFSGVCPFARWMKANHPDMVSNGYPKGKQLWYSKLHGLGTQSIGVHEAACDAFAEVWKAQGVELKVRSRLD